MNSLDNAYKELSAIDPVTLAEQNNAADVGLAALQTQIAKSKLERIYLSRMLDTQFSNTEADYTAIACAFGFEVAGSCSIPYINFEKVHRTERMVTLAHRELGLVIVYTTYSGEEVARINKADMYFALNPNDLDSGRTLRISGGLDSPSEPKWRMDPKYFVEQEDGSYKSSYPTDLVLMGSFGEQQALLYNIRQLKEHGTLMPVWPHIRPRHESYFTCEYDYSIMPGHSKEDRAKRDVVAAQRFAALPDWCKAIFNGNAF